MSAKKIYNTGDTVWISGIENPKLTEGKIVKQFTLEEVGYSSEYIFYVIQIPTAIEPLLEIRTWETMSEDARGPLGFWRKSDLNAVGLKKFFSKAGVEVACHPELETGTIPPKRHRRRKK